MPKASKISVIETPQELKNRLQSSVNHRVRLKIKSLLLLQEEVDRKRQIDIANHLCIGFSTLKEWYRDYSVNGIDSFLKVKAKGKPKSLIPIEVHKALEIKLNDSENPLLGYWDAVLWVKNNHQLEIKYTTLRKYMITNFGTKLKSPRKSHYKKDDQAIEAFFKTPQ